MSEHISLGDLKTAWESHATAIHARCEPVIARMVDGLAELSPLSREEIEEKVRSEFAAAFANLDWPGDAVMLERIRSHDGA